ncbi:MAG: alpha/beta hydrolase [Pseudomonadota bacterium]
MAAASLALLAVLVLGLLLSYAVATSRANSAEAAYPPEGAFVEVQGRRVHYVEAGEGPPLILLHGAGGSTRDFSFDLIARLARDFRVIAFDRPGLGYSDRLHGMDSVFSLEAESPQAQAAHLAAAARQLGVERPIVVGHSFGGAIAYAWALDHDPAALVSFAGVANPWPGKLYPIYRVHDTALSGAVLPVLIAAWTPNARIESGISGTFAPQSMPDGYDTHIGVSMSVRPDIFRTNIRQVNALYPHIVQMSARYDELTLPIEILHGTADLSVPLRVHSGPFADRIASANLTVLDGVGHMPHHVDPDAAVAAINRAAERAGLKLR